MFQKIKDFMSKQRELGEGVKILRLIGSNIILIGLSFVMSYFVSIYFKENWIKYDTLLKSVNTFGIVWLCVGLIIVLIGISIVANYCTEEKLDKLMKEKNWKIFSKQIPYTTVLTIVFIFISYPLLEDNPEWIEKNFNLVTIMITLVIYFLLTVCMKIILNSTTIFKNSIQDSKDRLTIIITIFATIISAIALFK